MIDCNWTAGLMFSSPTTSFPVLRCRILSAGVDCGLNLLVTWREGKNTMNDRPMEDEKMPAEDLTSAKGSEASITFRLAQRSFSPASIERSVSGILLQ